MYKNSRILKNFIFLTAFLACFMFSSVAAAQKELIYHTIDPNSKQIIQKFKAIIMAPDEKGQRIYWEVDKQDRHAKEEYFLADDYETKSWQVTSLDGQTEYRGTNQYGKLFIHGEQRGYPVHKKLKIDSKYPFYANPKFGLMQFVRSGQKTWKFWGLRNDELTRHLMVATNQGEELVLVGGKEVPAIRIHWTVAGIGSLFFERYYWFRKSDGMYLRQIVDEKYVRELVSEKDIN